MEQMNIRKKTGAMRKKRRSGTLALRLTACCLLAGLSLPLLLAGCNGGETPDNPSSLPESDIPSSVPSQPEESEPENVWVPEAFFPDPETGVIEELSDLYKTNADLVGRISIPGTRLVLPVVQGDDNAYYLDRNFEKAYDPYGVPYVDYRATISEEYQSTNITIYAHSNSKEGTYFAPAKLYKDATLEYYREHPVITFDTIYGKGEYKVIAVMLVNTDVESEELFNFQDYIDLNEEGFNAYIEKVRAHSYFENPDVDVKYGDQLLTLSTCDDEIVESNTMPYRVALVARKTRSGESRDVDVSQAEPNEDVVMPAAWVEKFGVNTPFERE